MISSRPPGLSAIDQVVADWIKIQSFVSVQIRSFLSDVDGFKDFSLTANLDPSALDLCSDSLFSNFLPASLM